MCSRPFFTFLENALDIEPYVRARAGIPSAVDEVVDLLRPRISRMSAHYARRAGEDPDDLQQEAWLAVLESLPMLDLRIGSPDQFLIQRARWRVLDAIKRARLRRCAPIELVPEESHTHDHSGILVTDFSRSLKPNQRAILSCLLKGLTWREAGSRLGCTSPNIAYHVREMRRRFEEWSAEPAR